MKETMKRVAALMLVTALLFGVAQTTKQGTAKAAGKYTLKVKNITMEVGQQKTLNVTTKFKDYASSGKTIPVGKSRGYWVDSMKGIKYKVISGKNKVKVTKYGDVTAKKAGTAKIRVTATYYNYIAVANSYGENDGGTKRGKKLATVKKTVKVKIKNASPIPKEKCKVSDKTMQLDSSDDYVDVAAVYNKTRTFYAKPVLSYKIISGGEHVKVNVRPYDGDCASIVVEPVSIGTAEIELTVTYQKYQVSANGKKDKLVDKNYATSTSKIMVEMV